MPWRLLISLHKRRLPRPRVAAEMDEQRVCARPRSVPLVIARLWTARLPGKAQPEQMRDRAKDPLSLARSQRNWRKSAEIQALGTGRSRRKYPANKPKSGVAHAWIAPRRSPVRVRLAPLHEPLLRRGFWRLGDRSVPRDFGYASRENGPDVPKLPRYERISRDETRLDFPALRSTGRTNTDPNC